MPTRITNSISSITQKMGSTLGRALFFVWSSSPRLTISYLALILLQGILSLLSLYLAKLLVNAITANVQRADLTTGLHSVLPLMLCQGATALGLGLAGSLQTLITDTQGPILTDHMIDLLNAKAVEVDQEYYESPQFYDTLHRAQQEAPYRPLAIITSLVQLFQNASSLLLMSGLFLCFDWKVFMLVLATSVPVLLVNLRHSRQIYRWHLARTPEERRTRYYLWMITSGLFSKEIRMFDLGATFQRQFSARQRKLRLERRQLIRQRHLALMPFQFIVMLALGGIFALMIYRTLSGRLSLGAMFMYTQAMRRAQSSLQGSFSALSSLYESNLFLANVFVFLGLSPKVVDPVTPLPLPAPLREGIEFDRVSFRYPHCDEFCLEEISLSVRPGEKIALVGVNGSGKTTLLKLLARLYDPTQGVVRMDGIDIRELDSRELRQRISIIFQDFARFNLTAWDNIALGDINHPPEALRVESAAHAAGAAEFIERFPKGYQTVLGRWFEEGQELSGGEWQKVALSRAFLRASQILVFDEPTSSLDPQSEYEFYSRLRAMDDERMVILITHRFPTLVMADRIFLLEKGRIVEQGSHEELLRRSERYARMFEIQCCYHKDHLDVT